MTPRENVYRAYWELAAKRQQIFFARLHGQPQPWTNDPILREYKFCCTYRASDRVSQFLIREVIYDGIKRSSEDIVFRILLFKIFNQIETWKHLKERIGDICYHKFNYAKCADLLEEYQRKGNPVYNNAYMSCATKAYGYDQKHRNHLALVRAMVHEGHIADKILEAKKFEDIFLILKSYPLIGNFMAYQLAIDINYSEATNFSEDDFTVVGPGSERGIRKCFVDTGSMGFSDVIQWMTDNQEREFARLGIEFPDLWGRRLHAIDCQGLFCETDKYSRVRFPDLKSNRKRIKARHNPNPQPISYFYPPKWKINERMNYLCPKKKADSRQAFQLTA